MELAHRDMENDALRARVARLEEALREILNYRGMATEMKIPFAWSTAATNLENIARRALEEK